LATALWARLERVLVEEGLVDWSADFFVEAAHVVLAPQESFDDWLFGSVAANSFFISFSSLFSFSFRCLFSPLIEDTSWRTGFLAFSIF
jgi:hypothetical protein